MSPKFHKKIVTVFKGGLLKLVTDQRRLPNGHIVNLEIIHHPGAVLIVPFLAADRILLLRQFRPVFNTYLYELPAGTLNPKENVLQCARRELIEETGYCAQKWRKVGKIFPVPGYSTETITIFKAQSLRSLKEIAKKGTPQDVHQDPDEVIKVHIVNQSQIRSLFRKGRIYDAKTICALAFCGMLA